MSRTEGRGPGVSEPYDGEARSPTRTLVRGLRLLELIGAARDGATVMDLAAAAELDKATVSRLLATIRSVGWAVQSPVDRKYRLAGKALSLSHDTSNHVDVQALARAQLGKLRERWNETVNLGIVEGHDVLYIEVVHSTAAVRVMPVIGQRMPLVTTALGRAFLSQMPESEVDQLLDVLPHSPKSSRERAALLDELRLCRDRGYAIDDQMNDPEILCVGSAIVDVSGSPVATLSISGPAYRMRPRLAELGASCATAARAVSLALGAPGSNEDR
jgi:DNA-binding IclR family transcriptional regulator